MTALEPAQKSPIPLAGCSERSAGGPGNVCDSGRTGLPIVKKTKSPGLPPYRVGASQRTGPPLHPQGHPKILSNRSAESILRPHPCARMSLRPLGQESRAGSSLPQPDARPPPFPLAVRLACAR